MRLVISFMMNNLDIIKAQTAYKRNYMAKTAKVGGSLILSQD